MFSCGFPGATWPDVFGFVGACEGVLELELELDASESEESPSLSLLPSEDEEESLSEDDSDEDSDEADNPGDEIGDPELDEGVCCFLRLLLGSP